MFGSILSKVLGGEKEVKSPFAPEIDLRFVFVILDTKSRMGFLWIWCPETKKGWHVSRLRVPINIKNAVDGEAFDKMDIPNFEVLPV